MTLSSILLTVQRENIWMKKGKVHVYKDHNHIDQDCTTLVIKNAKIYYHIQTFGT